MRFPVPQTKDLLQVMARVGTLAAVLGLAGCSALGRSLLFLPSHHLGGTDLTPWFLNGALIGYSRPVASPRNVWLMLHGNAGQASDRAYALSHFSPQDAVFVLEYPGYGSRPGTPSSESFNAAAQEAYLSLRATFPGTPIGVVGESIGSGPAATLAALPAAPDKIVLVVPFDRLSAVAKDHFPSIVVRLLLQDEWDNVASLRTYPGPIEIFGAENDTVIPIGHARALAAALPHAKFTPLPGGHNDWPAQAIVRIRNP